MPSRQPDRGQRNHALDLMRLGLATLVLLAHAPEITDGDQRRELWSRLTHSSMTFGAVGVDGFFALSGYLIVKSWDQNPELKNFLVKRLLRIVPGYLVAVLLSILIVGLLAPAVPQFFHHMRPGSVVSVALMMRPSTPAVFPGSSLAHPGVNNSLWTIAYEFRCYLLVAFLGMCGLIRRPLVWPVLLVVDLALVLAFGTHDFRWHTVYQWVGEPHDDVRLLLPFLVGGCFYLFRQHIRFKPLYAGAAVLPGLFAGWMRPEWVEPAVVFAGSYLLFYFAQMSIRTAGWIKGLPDISYGVYLYGWPVEALWIWYRHGSPWVAFAVATAITYGLGWISWHFVERPMLRLKRKPTASLAPA